MIGHGWLVAGFVVWSGLVLSASSLVLGPHMAPLPGPTTETETVPPAERWRAIHILDAECSCSRSIAAYLKARGRDEGLLESVWLMGKDDGLEEDLRLRGFQIELVDAADLEVQRGIHGAPWLLLVEPSGRGAYSGGYASRNPRWGGEICDLAIWRDLKEGKSVAALPAFGCATGAALKRTRDPLALGD